MELLDEFCSTPEACSVVELSLSPHFPIPPFPVDTLLTLHRIRTEVVRPIQANQQMLAVLVITRRPLHVEERRSITPSALLLHRFWLARNEGHCKKKTANAPKMMSLIV